MVMMDFLCEYIILDPNISVGSISAIADVDAL